MIEYVKGDIFETDADIIVHQVNCQGVMGSGIAKEIKTRYPKAFTSYLKYCKMLGGKLLGKIQPVDCDDIIVINLFGQEYYGRGKKQYTDYEEFDNAMKKIYDYATVWNYNVAMPYKIGCGLGGGNWEVIKKNIEKYFSKTDLICKIYIKE